MVQLIVGKKGKGKTKQLLDKVNSEVKDIAGSIVYLDKSTKHMYELNNKVRLIDVSRYMIENESEFLGFVCGIISHTIFFFGKTVANLMITLTCGTMRSDPRCLHP